LPEGLNEGDRAAVVVKDGEVEQVIGGGFPFFLPGLLPDGHPKPFDDEGGIVPRPFRDFHGCPCEEVEPEAAPET